MQNKPDGLVLFSGGLDSLLAALLLAEQGLKIHCLHFTSPFFGSASTASHWHEITGLEIETIDASRPFTAMLAARPPHGTGKVLNPCLDCKILLLRLARERLVETGANFLASGEVRGQRPMSQRPDAMNIVLREAGVKGLLLRPLSAQLLPPTPAEECGLVDRSRLLRISGRGRLEQLELAKKLGLKEIPTPGGGCRLTERENARRYWPLLNDHWNNPGPVDTLVRDFHRANLGRMHLNKNSGNWLLVGRNRKDNERIANSATSEDILLRLPFPGPLGLAVRGACWPEHDIEAACAILASYMPKSRDLTQQIKVLVQNGQREFLVKADRNPEIWALPDWETTKEAIRQNRLNYLHGLTLS